MNNIDLTKISDDLFSLIIQLNSKLFSSSKMVKCSPLPPSHVKVIFHLMNNGSSSISDIASSLCISKPNMTPIIDKLIKEDLVCRQEDCNDRRIIRIQLTQKAYEIAHAHEKSFKNILLDKISNLDSEDLYNMGDLIVNINSIINKLK